jgi:hypothetical protein
MNQLCDVPLLICRRSQQHNERRIGKNMVLKNKDGVKLASIIAFTPGPSYS